MKVWDVIPSHAAHWVKQSHCGLARCFHCKNKCLGSMPRTNPRGRGDCLQCHVLIIPTLVPAMTDGPPWPASLAFVVSSWPGRDPVSKEVEAPQETMLETVFCAPPVRAHMGKCVPLAHSCTQTKKKIRKRWLRCPIDRWTDGWIG